MPILIAVIAQDYTQALLLKPIFDNLGKIEILFFTIGLAQLLETYAGVFIPFVLEGAVKIHTANKNWRAWQAFLDGHIQIITNTSYANNSLIAIILQI